jgi:hypothetical protein
MFGIYKERILQRIIDDKRSLNESYSSVFGDLYAIISKSEKLSALHTIYTDLLEYRTDNMDEAKDYLTEVVESLNNINLTDEDIIELKTLSESVGLPVNNIVIESVDNLSKNKYNIKNKIESKKTILNYLTRPETALNKDLVEDFNLVAANKIRESLKNLDENSLKQINVLLDKDNIKDNFLKDLNETISLVDDKILSEHNEIKPTLIEVRRKLVRMIPEEVSVDNYINLIQLKNGLKDA